MNFNIYEGLSERLRIEELHKQGIGFYIQTLSGLGMGLIYDKKLVIRLRRHGFTIVNL